MSASASSSRKTRKKNNASASRPRAGSAKKKTAPSKTVAPDKPVEVKTQIPAESAQGAAAQEQPEQQAVVTDDQVGQRAYEIWIEKGRPYGQEQANWDQAVAELRG